MKDDDNTKAMEEDMSAIAQMIREAELNGLLVEVIMEYGDQRRAGNDVQLSAAYALAEWDI